MEYKLNTPYIPPTRLPFNYDSVVGELLGLAKGILADGKVTADEVKYLRSWVQEHRECAGHWPVNIIAQQLATMSADDSVSDEGCRCIAAVLNELTGDKQPTPRFQDDPTTCSCFKIPEPEVHFAGRAFCLTGNFAFGPKRLAAEEIIKRGGIVLTQVLKEMDYLVVGSIVNKSWAHGNFGRKIEKVMTQWSHVAIISEQHWTKALNL